MNARSLLFLAPLALLAAAGAVACGSDADEPKQSTSPTSPSSTGGDAASPGACEAAGTALCARACACATDGKCHFAIPTDAGAATIHFESEKACRDLYVGLGCVAGGEPGMDYGACEAKATAAACVDSAGGRGAVFPPECKTTK